MKKYILIVLLLVFASSAHAYDMYLSTDKYTYSLNESIFSSAQVRVNSSSVANVSIVFSIYDQSSSLVSSNSFTTNDTGHINYTFSISSKGNYTIIANVSGDYVSHFIRVLSYSSIDIFTNTNSYATGSSGTIYVFAKDKNGAGASNEAISASIRFQNGSLSSSLSGCTTDSIGKCSINFTAPSEDGSYIIDINNYEVVLPLFIGGSDVFMAITPTTLGINQNVTIRVTVKNANGNGITASTRQLTIKDVNGTTKQTVSSMSVMNDTSGSVLVGVYQETIAMTEEGIYSVKTTVQAQGSNITRELTGSFDVRSYSMDITSLTNSVLTPGESASFAIKLRNASTNEFMTSAQCGSGSCINSIIASNIYDPKGLATSYALSVSEQTSDGYYRMNFDIPSSAESGVYKLVVSFSDSFGSAYAVSYFFVQPAKGKMRSIDKFPNGASKETFLPGKQIVLEFSASNSSGYVNITALDSYKITDEDQNDVTEMFKGQAYSVNNNKSYINLTAANKGGRYAVKAKLNTSLGSISIEGWFFVDVLNVEIRPQSIGGSSGMYTPFGGPGYMFSFRPNDTVQLRVTVMSASEKRGHEGFMGAEMSKGGSASGGPSIGSGGMFGVGGGSALQGVQIAIDKIININTNEDATSSATITNCITDSSGMCTLTLKSNVNSQNWTNGFYVVYVNATTNDNQTDKSEGFFEIRKYFVNIQTRAQTAKNATNSGFTSFNDWFLGPEDNINVSINVIEPGTWQSSSFINGTAVVNGVYFTGSIGEFINPPKLQTNQTVLMNISSGGSSTVVQAPASGWKSGYYVVKVSINISGVLDSGEGFMMVRIYQGFGEPINSVTQQRDFTTSSNENVTMKVNVFNVKSNQPAANLTVSLDKILSFESFPPNEITYDKSSVQTATTDGNGQAIIAIPVPSTGWSNGNYLVSFTVTNGTVSDKAEGYFQVKNFFAELSSSKWRFARNETVVFNITISSDPSWMRQNFGGGCPVGDPMCSNKLSGSGGGGGGPQENIHIINSFAIFGLGLDIDDDGIKDINITTLGNTGLLTLVNNSNATKMGISNKFWCSDTRECQQSPIPEIGNITNGFDSVDCGPEGHTYSNVTSHNMSGPSFFCVNTTSGLLYKIRSSWSNESGLNIEYAKHVKGSIGGVGPIDTTGSQGFQYYNATVRSVKVIKFDFNAGETILRNGIDFNLTSQTESTTGEGNILIPGIGLIKIKPIGTWSTGFYRVIAEFNTTPQSVETAESGFSVETFFANCYRNSWGSVSSSSNMSINCNIQNPEDYGNYTSDVEIEVESIRNSYSRESVSSWSSTKNYTNSQGVIWLYQSLGNGQYEAIIKLNSSPTDIKRQNIWFEVKDFQPNFYTERWSYSSSDNISIIATGNNNGQNIAVNLSNNEITVYKYDKATWSKSVVSGFTILTNLNQTDMSWPSNKTTINISKAGGWDEGSYEITANLTKINSQGEPIGGEVEVRTWFDIKLFDVWGWSNSWSNHPKSNITLKINVGPSGSWNQRYTSQVMASIASITNTQTNDILSSSYYSATNMTAVPSSVGELNLTITPSASGIPVGTYKATVSVVDSSSSKSVTTDIWFDVKAFQLSAYADRYQYSSDENININLNVQSQDPVNISNAVLTYLSRCSSTCSTVDINTVNTIFNNTANKLTILNSSGFSTGYYWANLLVNDSQNSSATTGVSFSIKSFGVTGVIERPSQTRYSYYINESLILNVTGTIGVNIRNATIDFWDCAASCELKNLLININRTLENKTEIIYIQPVGLNNTWVTSEYGWAGYSVTVNSVYGEEKNSFYTYASITFPYIWNITGVYKHGLTDNITANITVYVDSFTTKSQILNNAVVNVSKVLRTSDWREMNSTSNAWNQIGNITSTSASVTVIPNTTIFNWTIGYMAVEYVVKYGNATTRGYFNANIAQKTLSIISKTLRNSDGNSISNAEKGVLFNLSVQLSNPSENNANAVATIRISNSALNSSAQIANLTPLELINIEVPSGGYPIYNFTLNVSGSSNTTSTINVIPSTEGFAKTTSTYSYGVI